MEVTQHAAGDMAGAIIGEQLTSLVLAHRRIKGQNIELLFVSSLVADDPIGDDEVGE